MHATSQVNRPSASSVSRSTTVGISLRASCWGRSSWMTDAVVPARMTENDLVPGNGLLQDIRSSRIRLDWETLPLRCFRSIPGGRILVTGVTLPAAIALTSAAAAVPRYRRGGGDTVCRVETAGLT